MVDLISAFNVEILESPKEYIFRFPYRNSSAWEKLKEEIKGMEGARFHKEPLPHWRAKNTLRNKWIIEYLKGNDPYARYRMSLMDVQPKRGGLYDHQHIGLRHVMTRKQCILAAEMGTGKTLVIIEALEKIKPSCVWYIAPRFSIGQLRLLFRDWKSEVQPTFLSYEDMKKIVREWKTGDKAPQVLVFDESAFLKTPSSARSEYALHLANGTRLDHGDDAYIILASGAPAPKSPKDWWHQCEVACPGYLKESNIYDFEKRLALIQKETSFAGGSYPKIVTWWDDENKCRVCGQLKDHSNHERSVQQKIKEVSSGLAGLLDINTPMTDMPHSFEPSTNEVANLAKRMSGLVLVQFKKDCLQLPDKVYRIVRLEVSPKIKRAASLITRTSSTTIEALTRLRELSDGFQYTQEPSGEFETCKRCYGTTKIFEGVDMVCPSCKDGKVEKMRRIANRVSCPKDNALLQLLDECEDRIVIFGGFTETIDRVVEVCKRAGWDVIRADGTTANMPHSMDCTMQCGNKHPLEIFQDKSSCDKVAFVAHPATAKTSLTLTASNMIVYYSNTFNADDRIQSEDRIHRIGMDMNKGAVIVDLVHLDSDMYVRENLRLKRVLQSITLGELQQYMEENYEQPNA